MKSIILIAICLPIVLATTAPRAEAHGIFKKAMVAHYGFAKTSAVNCMACHAKEAEVPKENAWGKSEGLALFK